MKYWPLLTILISSALLAQDEAYKWVDADGTIHYSDQPPPPSARNIERKRLGDKPGEVSLPYVLQQAVKNFPVTIYANECGDACNRARTLLAKRGVPHTIKDPLAPGMREELNNVTAGQAVMPVLQVGRRVLLGFAEGRWNAALDEAGYPKFALVKVTPVQAKPAPVVPPAAPEEQAPEEQAPEAESEPAEPEQN